MFEVVFSRVSLVDGSGEPRRTAWVGLENERIQAVSDTPLVGREMIDGLGKILSPGFIDVHSHDDFAALFEPELPFKVLQGVTSEIVGNCGIGAAPFPGAEDWLEKLHPGADVPGYSDYTGYLLALEATRPSLNLGVLAGHGALRRAVAPEVRGPLSTKQRGQMRDELSRALESGVLGMSAGLIYEPGVHSDEEELVELCQRLAPEAPLFTVHLRSEADGLIEAVEEALRIARRAGVGLQLSHHKAHGRNNWGLVKQSLKLVEEARERGEDVWLDQYPYAAGSTIFRAVMDRGGLRGGRALGVLLPRDIFIASSPSSPSLEGKSLEELAVRWEVEPERAAERVLEESPGCWVVVHAMDEKDVQAVMMHPATLFGSDGLPTPGGRPHPRLYGTFPRILGHYCRVLGILSLEEAIAKMTSRCAARFGLRDRGIIREGAFADLVLFDEHEVDAKSTYEDPRQPPSGIFGVWVNGVRVVENGVHTKARPGRVLRREGLGLF